MSVNLSKYNLLIQRILHFDFKDAIVTRTMVGDVLSTLVWTYPNEAGKEVIYTATFKGNAFVSVTVGFADEPIHRPLNRNVFMLSSFVRDALRHLGDFPITSKFDQYL